MRSSLVKVLHPVLGRPLLSYPLTVALTTFYPEKTVVVVGHQADRVRAAFPDTDVTFVVQEEQLGTGHAVLTAQPAFQRFEGTVLILCGDVPLITPETLMSFVEHHREQNATVSVLTAHMADPTGYGRIIRSPGGIVDRIVEEKDATAEERRILEINSGIYCVEAPFLFQALVDVNAENVQGEYYLPDVVDRARHRGRTVVAMRGNPAEIMGVNTRADLSAAERHLGRRIKEYWMLQGVTIYEPETVRIEADVQIQHDTIIHSCCSLCGETSIGSGCCIGPNVYVVDSVLGDRVTVGFGTAVTESRLENEADIGPLVHLHRNMRLSGQGMPV
jgi:bifunctional UDP-N-acetylglucosamine pyrophosphorylase/glucosamine-1-phosphate N-acetyltransferase